MLDISRWQFGITTAYHFLCTPITIGLAFVVARHGRLPQRVFGAGPREQATGAERLTG